MNVLYSGFFFILAAAVQAQSIHNLSGTDQFHRAYFDEKSHEVAFEPFQNLNWEAKARAALPWLNPDHPTPPQIARLSTFESAGPQFRSVDFRAPVDPSVSRVKYFLVSPAGIMPLQPVQLKGSVDFDFDTSVTAVQRKVVFGTVVGKPARPVTAAAFAFAGRVPDVTDVHPGATFERRKQAGPAVYDFANGGRIVSWPISSNERPDVASALSFHLAGQGFLLVKWNSDFCLSAYTLFSAGAALKPIAGNDYDCDP